MKEYQYILTYGATIETLTINPAGWDKLGITLMRHEVYKSVLRTFTLSLRFANEVGGGYSLIKQAYETDGINAEVSIEIKKRNSNTNDYDAFYTGILDFTPGKFTFDRELFVEISIIDSSILQKFISRDENEIDIFASKDLDDNSITPITASEITLTPVDITLQTIKDIYHGGGGGFSLTNSTDSKYLYSRLSTVQPASSKNENGTDYAVTEDEASDAVVYTNNYDFTVNVKFQWEAKYSLSVEFKDVDTGTKIVSIGYFKYKNGGTTIYSDILFLRESTNSSRNQTFNYTGYLSAFNIDDLPSGGTIELYIHHYADSPIGLGSSVEIVYLDGIIPGGGYPFPHWLSVIVPGKDETTANCLFAFDAIDKSFEILTGSASALESVMFDTGGTGENDIILSGLQIRKYPDPQVFITFKKLFESFSARRNLGLWYDVVNGNLVIEFIGTFYNNNKIFTFGEVSKFKEQAYNAYYSKIEAGYDYDGDYERVQGAYEFAVAKEYSTSSKVKETKNIRSYYRADSVGIEELRNQLYDDKGNIDNNSDNDIFIIDTDGLKPTVISDDAIPYDGYEYFHTYYNTNFTPRQNAVRHGNMLAANSWNNTIPIKSQKSDKQFILDVNSIDENSDITVAELGLPLIIPKLYTFQYYLTDEQIQDILSDPHGYGEFYYNGKYYIGYINKVELNSDYGGLANFELIAKNTEIIYRTFEDNDLHVFTDDDQKING